ncbi:uncharacterized protein LAJ45_05946 [Morchella importuna]|uniref:uncharacterized protein n=1 Tax=Morchella importuna TaxID=1174673 RepID=UPI001E8DC37A|nr:uncharacterized protein LAJ45_05946 [Morchella importuna]KAH8149794.1 hypothetical protein LAJ45_05946 [Morchella importuna]
MLELGTGIKSVGCVKSRSEWSKGAFAILSITRCLGNNAIVVEYVMLDKNFRNHFTSWTWNDRLIHLYPHQYSYRRVYVIKNMT